MRAFILSKKNIAEGTMEITFQLPEEIKFIPGQFFFLKLLNPPYNDDKGPERHFSIVNSPSEKGILTMATRMGESALKRSLAELPEETQVEIGNINGSFQLPGVNGNPIVFMAAGIGITPFISMLRYIKKNNLDYELTLLYANRNSSSTAYLRELKDMEKSMDNFHLVLSMTDDPDWEGEKRKFTPEMIKEHISDPQTSIFMVAGPPGMVKAASESLSELSISPNNIITENFSGY